jgi:hypothetical protein
MGTSGDNLTIRQRLCQSSSVWVADRSPKKRYYHINQRGLNDL